MGGVECSKSSSVVCLHKSNKGTKSRGRCCYSGGAGSQEDDYRLVQLDQNCYGSNRIITLRNWTYPCFRRAVTFLLSQYTN